MPYPGIAFPEITAKMERCVEDVMQQGKDKATAIAICRVSITGKKLLFISSKEYEVGAEIEIKAGRFVTIDGQVVFIGGPGQGGGGSGGGGGGQYVVPGMEGILQEPEPEDLRWQKAQQFSEDDSYYEMRDWGNTEYEEALDQIKDSGDESDAVSAYSGDAYEDINSNLRGAWESNDAMDDLAYEHFVNEVGMDADEFFSYQAEMVDEYREILVNHLETAISRGVNRQDLIVYRGVKDHVLEGFDVGDIFTDDGFMSTTISPKEANTFGDRIMQIRVPAGTNSLFLDGLSGFETELEILFNYGSEMRIVEMSYDRVILEMLP